MKRAPSRAWPREIVEVPPQRPDGRADPQATQKISRAQLDEALARTKSGTRRATRSYADLDDLPGPRDDSPSLPAPRDDSPEVTIVRIDSVEIDRIDPACLPRSEHAPAPPAPSGAPRPLAPVLPSIARRPRVSPRFAFLVGVALIAIVAIAALAGFLVGRSAL